ncbi:chemotaxis protein CheW [Aminipila sp.]|uniref:chemotaxis protein CheW n=1 Tax=Aminipila sp. TaxID=2060095 RepID=UPI00289EE1F4|nr:CZB domain-containing protein [Aminipila sp.]
MNIEHNPIEVEENEESWLILKLKEQTFAVNCQDVIGIFRAETEISQMAGYSGHVRGVIDFRGSVVPLLELRSVLGMTAFEQEHREFCDMMELRKGDHIRWVQELQRCIHEKDEFKLATDPHQCAFGKWYDSYHTDNQSVLLDLRKIDEPHKKLHETALKVFECNHIQDEEARKIKEEELMQKASEEYMPKVVRLLEEMKQVYKEGFREMCVVIVDEKEKMLGLLVDEVTAVESLSAVESKNLFNSAFSASCVNHVAKSKNIKGEVFVLNKDILFSKLF